METNYFGKGNTTTYDRATYVPVASPQNTFHTYTIDWTAEHVKWIVDGNVIRTLLYNDANGGKNFPQTPMQVKMGNWVGGSSTAPEGTVQWAGGKSDFSKAPFTMLVKSVTIQDYSTGGAEYVYSDLSGSWQSIKTSGTPGSSGNSSSGSSSSGSSSNSSSAASNGTSAATASSVSTAPVASGTGLGAGAVTQPPSSAATGASSSGTSTGTAGQAKSTNSGAVSLKASNFALVLLGLGLGYLVM